MTYLDYAAKAPTKYPSSDFTDKNSLNPNQPYAHVERKRVETAEQITLTAMGSKTGHVVFGANATMLFDWLAQQFDLGGSTFIMSAYEHDCVNWMSKYMDINPYSLKAKDITEVEDWFAKHDDWTKEEPGVCFWMWVQNLTGEEFDIKRLGKLCHEHNILFVSDFTAGMHNEKIPEGIDDWCDIAVFSGAKIGAECGTGAMWICDKLWKEWKAIDWLPHFGTSNEGAAMAIANAVNEAQSVHSPKSDDLFEHWKRLYWHLMDNVPTVEFEEVLDLVGGREFYSATLGIIMLHLAGINADAFQQYAASKGVYFSVFHSACAGSGDYRIAEAYGIDKQTASECIRLSFGYDTTTEDIDEFIKVFKEYKDKFIRK